MRTEKYPPIGSRVARLVLAVALLVTTSSAIQALPDQPFEVGCTLPFDAIKHKNPIDDTCPRRGNIPDPPPASDANAAPNALQNLAKNNFCATGGPALVTFLSFKKLQTKLDHDVPAAKHWSRFKLPADRTPLTGLGYTTSENDVIGEDSVVHLSAWLKSQRGKSVETCNCELGDTEDVDDIHVVLVSNKNVTGTPECSSVTAEISPHYRPTKWSSTSIAAAATGHPLRITGQLFYDAAHRPCSGNPPTHGSGAPSRVSSWEIHPVYGLDVCSNTSLAACRATDDSVWTPVAP